MHAVGNIPRYASESRTIFTLPGDIRTLSLARACRGAFVAFCNGAARWEKRDLACWLAGPYAEVTRPSHELSGEPDKRESHARIRVVDPSDLAHVVGDALRGARHLLHASMASEGGALQAWEAWRRGFVVRCEDEDQNEGWLPVDRPTMHLADRLLSLWAADYLASPEDYESYLGICDVCHTATFDPFLRARGRCAIHSAAPRNIAVEWPEGQGVYSSHLVAESKYPASEPRSKVHKKVR